MIVTEGENKSMPMTDRAAGEWGGGYGDCLNPHVGHSSVLSACQLSLLGCVSVSKRCAVNAYPCTVTSKKC